MTFALQCAKGKKATELAIISAEALDVSLTNFLRTSEEAAIAKEKANVPRNLSISSAARDLMQKTLALPVQEMKQIAQEKVDAKQIKIGVIDADKQAQWNPDTSAGLCVCDGTLTKARAVQKAKDQHEEDERKRHEEAEEEKK